MRRNAPLLLSLGAALVAACGGTPILDTRTFQLKYLRASQAQDIVSPYVFADRPNAKGAMSTSNSTITVRETRDNLDKIARVLAQYDVPRPLVRLTFHLIQATRPARRAGAGRMVLYFSPEPDRPRASCLPGAPPAV